MNNVKRFVNEVKRKIEKINDNVKIGYLYRSIGLDLLLIYRPQLCPVEPSVKDFAIPSTINPYKRDGILNYS